MLKRTGVVSCLALLLALSASAAGVKNAARVARIDTLPHQHLGAAPMFSAAVACTVGNDSAIAYYIDGWVAGAELYKAYIDPGSASSGCTGPYPFTIRQINMPMRFRKACSLTVSVDVEAVDASNPNCHVPGALKAISSDWNLTVPAAGGYNIWIPLDTPYVVSGPFFAGFYISTPLDTSVGAAIYCDNDPRACFTYNIWDTTIGFVDLVNNDYYNFPGRLALYVIGSPGGGSVEPAPVISFLKPVSAEVLMGSVDLWAWEKSGSKVIDYVSFAYSKGGAYTEIGRDYDGTHALRNGVQASDAGIGYDQNWDFSGLPEGNYTLKVTAVDTLGRTAWDTVTVYLKSQSPAPRITSPANGDDFCSSLTVLMQSNDPALSNIQLFRTNAQTNYTLAMPPLNQQLMGDVNGNPNDGNHVSSGEFGEYCSGPAAVAAAVKVWADRGFVSLMNENMTTLTPAQLGQRLAVAFKTQADNGTYDENLYTGLKDYFVPRGDMLSFDMQHNPDYYALRSWVEDEQRTVVLGLGGNPGLWVAVNGFSGWKNADGSYTVSIMNPLTGTIMDAPMRTNLGSNELSIGGVWHSVDIMVSLFAKTWNVTRVLASVDMNGADGWSITWTPVNLSEGNPYIFRAIGRDAGNYRGASTLIMRYKCLGVYRPGDFDNDGQTDIADLQILIDFITHGEPSPIGGAARADCNCDRLVNVADIIYYINFLFSASSAPCY
ncbi:MAG TPA: hypothetical protein VMS71_07470 [Candidatus Acidoferrum sp.]|nr:hypothetical protein [Candidatus Acidoferrum sp.]